MLSVEAMVDALNRYIDGKDNNRPAVLKALYCSDAVLAFSLDDQSMSFPTRVEGAQEIAKVLSGDFNQRYQRVKTWYLTQPVADGTDQVTEQPWLVMMQEKASGDIRIGCGFYNWRFETNCNPLQVSAHHIHIHTMLSFPSTRESWLIELQQSLAYPWSSVDLVEAQIAPYSELDSIVRYLTQRSEANGGSN